MARNLSRRGWLGSALSALLGPWAARLVGPAPAAAAAPPPVPAAAPPAGAVPVSWVGPVTSYCYDAVGTPYRGPVGGTVYDAAGNVLRTAGDPGHTTAYWYDSHGSGGGSQAT
jgi:hypothetical protein